MGEHSSNSSSVPKIRHHCLDCDETFDGKVELQRHVIHQMKKIPSQCRFCKRRYKSNCKLKAHGRLFHMEKHCPVCGKYIKDLSKHTGPKGCRASDCGKIISRKGTLPSQKRKGEKANFCHICGKNFYSRGVLYKHIGSHSGEKYFCCGVCGKSYNQKNSLKQHMLSHTGERPFSCIDCGKTFNRKETLTEHLITHTEEKPFFCVVCNKIFRHKQSLATHIRIHTGEKKP
ncbi:hypothetical protein UPYG_G00234640 [Umbra pygmaea]|uniref:C2H2-type domain-containing protein n=1 Tax=Umbra pygmaea TaxID=75934 RepID=A0ABD0WWC3_UMBPY